MAGVYSDTDPPRKTMRRGVLMTLLQQSAMTLPLWIGKPGERYSESPTLDFLYFRNAYLVWIMSQNGYISLIHTCLAPSVHHHCVALYQQAVTMWLNRVTRWRHAWRPWMVMSSGFLRKLSATITPPTSNHLPVELSNGAIHLLGFSF